MRAVMCARCIAIDKRIEHLRQLSDRILDRQTMEGIASLVAKLQVEKRELHSDGPAQ
jgi:hypothetical protein